MHAQRLTYAVVICLLVISPSCREQIEDNPIPGQPPQTFLWLFPDAGVGVGVSKSHLRWWGESPDGLVRGFLFSFKIVNENITTLPFPDTLRYTWVTQNDTTILFPLDTLFRKFAVVVRAVDYGFPGLPEQSIVRMLPFPFRDKNDNGVFDGDDQRLESLSQAIDPRGAVQTFPIRNSPPSIALLPNPTDPNSTQRLPDTTFTVVTLGFRGTDPDGDNTLASYRIVLNDTGASALNRPGHFASSALSSTPSPFASLAATACRAAFPASNFGVSTGDPEQPANPRPNSPHATCLRLIMDASPPCSLCYREMALKSSTEPKISPSRIGIRGS